MQASEIRRSFRQLDPARHPRLAATSRDAIYDEGRVMAPGGLLLARAAADALDLRPGERVLDLGAGRGQSSVMLAREDGAGVISVDLWIPAGERQALARRAGIAAKVTAIDADIRRLLPVPAGGVDAILSVRAFHNFGGSPGALRRLAALMRPGGRIVIAQACFAAEHGPLPEAFRSAGGLAADYERYHSPDWWRRHFERSGRFAVTSCRECRDGNVMWEDHALYAGDRAGWTPDFVVRFDWLFRQILHGRTQSPRLTHLMLAAIRV